MIRSGWILSALLFLPNALWMAFPPPPGSAPPSPRFPTWAGPLRPIEAVLRVVVVVLPCFLHLDFTQPAVSWWLVLAAVALTLYYGAWVRYFRGKRSPPLLYQRWLGVPVPLAVAPVLYLVAGAGLTRSVVLAVVAGVFGVIHVRLSLLHAQA